MNRRNGTVAVLLLKWLVVPAALLAVGYFLVGPFVPRILGVRAPLKSSDPSAKLQPEVQAQDDSPSYGEPQVEVSSEPAGRGYSSYTSNSSSSRRRHRRSKPKVEKPAENPVDAPPTIDPDSPPGGDETPPDTPPTTTTTTTGGGV